MNLKDLLVKAVYNDNIFIYLNLLQDSCDLEMGEIRFEYMNKDIEEIIAFIKESVSGIEKLDSLENKDEIISKIEKNIDKLAEVYRKMYVYSFKASIIEMILSERGLKEEMDKNGEKPNFDVDLFCESCEDFLNETDDEQEEAIRCEVIMSRLPMIFTKEKFLSYLKGSLAMGFEMSGENILAEAELIEQIFNADVCDIPNGIPKIEEELSKYIKAILEDSYGDIQKLYEEFADLTDNIQEMLMKFQILYDDLKSLKLLLAIGVGVSDILDSDVVYSDLQNTVEMILNNKTDKNDKEVYAESVVALLNNNIEKVSDEREAYAEEIDKMLSKVNKEAFKEEDTVTLWDIYGVLETNIAISTIEEKAFTVEKPDITKEEYDIEIEKMIDRIKEKMNTLSNKFRKKCMQFTLGIILPIWNKEEVLEYCRLSINSSASIESKAKALMDIAELMNLKADSEHHHNNCECGHHHDEDCGCEHEHHHHDDDCSCGHHHH